MTSLGVVFPRGLVFVPGSSRKRLFDLCGLVLILPLALPVMGLVILALMAQGGPVFFSQSRVGRDGRLFRMWKFRSMSPGAEAALAGLLAGDGVLARDWRQGAKLRHDPRVTPLGRILRRYSLDELPQLVNVARGEMSLVGPRPVPPHELGRYGADVSAYTAGRPGLTGLWQVSGRNDLSYAARVALDRRYRRNEGLRGDLAILGRTIGTVLCGTGR